MNMTMTLNPNGINHGGPPAIAPQPGMGLMALMATALPPTNMAALPSIVDASSKAAAAPTEAGQPLSQPGGISNGGSSTPGNGVDDNRGNNNNGSGPLLKFPSNGSRQSLTTNTVLERSPSSGSQILVPSALKASMPKLPCIGDANIQGAVGGGGPLLSLAPTIHTSSSSAPLLSVVSNNGTRFQPPDKGKSVSPSSLMLTFEGEKSTTGNSGSNPGYSLVGQVRQPATAHESSANSDSYDPEEDVMYRV